MSSSRPLTRPVHPARSARSAHRETLLLLVVRTLAGLHALVALAGMLWAAALVVTYLGDQSEDAMAGLSLVVAAGLALVALPLLVASSVAVSSHRPVRVHGWALAVVAWVVLVVAYTFSGGPGSWLLGIWVLFLPGFPVLAVPTVLLLLAALVGLAVRRGR